jgi:hypothetical protein
MEWRTEERQARGAVAQRAAGASFFRNFLLDIQIRFGRALTMKQNRTHSARCKTIDESAEILSASPRVTSHPGVSRNATACTEKEGAGVAMHRADSPFHNPAERHMHRIHHAAALLEPSRNAPRESAMLTVAKRLLHRMHNAPALVDTSRMRVAEARSHARSADCTERTARRRTLKYCGALTAWRQEPQPKRQQAGAEIGYLLAVLVNRTDGLASCTQTGSSRPGSKCSTSWPFTKTSPTA